MSNPIKLTAAISLPSGFEFGEVITTPKAAPVSPPPPALGPLAAFVGAWTGTGFNTIFRPNSAKTPTVLPIPVSSDNILELNLTSESLTFSPSLGNVPNRGSLQQADAFLNGVPYLQAINDVTTPGQVTGIHVEPGLWVIVPASTIPTEGPTVARMGSIPHGTTIQAQGTWATIEGPPNIPSVDITPFGTPATGLPAGANGLAGTFPRFPFPSQTAATQGTARIPQDLIALGTITQAMLDDPNSVLRNIVKTQKITSTTAITISTNPAAPLFGGGTDNIAFLTGDPKVTLTSPLTPLPPKPNAQTLQMTATFWIETVQHTILVPVFKLGQPPLLVKGQTGINGQPVPVFSVNPPVDITEPRQITVVSTQIQYSQIVALNFNGLGWPHVSVATLVPSDAVPVPPSAWA